MDQFVIVIVIVALFRSDDPFNVLLGGLDEQEQDWSTDS